MRFHALLHSFRTRYPAEISCFWGPLRALRMFFLALVRFLDEISCFLAAEFSFWWCDVRWVLKDAGYWVYTMVYWTLRSFVCASWVVRRWGVNVSWVVEVGESASALGDRRVCVEVVCFVSHGEPESGFFRLLFLRVDCECNRPSFLATVFAYTSAFNGNLNQWDVATVTTMSSSKSIRIQENDLTCRKIIQLRLGDSVGGLGWCWRCDVKMGKRWCWRMHYSMLCSSLPIWILVSKLWGLFLWVKS